MGRDNTRKGYRHTAHSQMLSMTLTGRRLERLGLVNMSRLYRGLSSQLEAG
ncbi:MAG: hypothetical protein LBW85_05430 [Deltaproteobacteria bacterium]|nr:hypothetical protein [Deltaproteobacteria bacterium]